MWRYRVVNKKDEVVKFSGFDFYDETGAMDAAANYVAKHKPVAEGSWSSTAESDGKEED
jgi:hypothetical protein